MPRNTKKASMRRPKKGIRFGHILLFMLIIILIGALVVGVMVANWVSEQGKDLPIITAEDLIMEQTSYVYDKAGQLLGKLHAGQDRDMVELTAMPPFLIDALIATEDIRFFEHAGVDTRSVLRAVSMVARDSLKNKSITFSEGASTITMQLVRNVVADTEKSMERKVKEALLALQFEKAYEKDEILYLYMNLIYLGKRTYGFDSAAKYYFGKELKNISISEAALMVGMLRNANYYQPYDYPERALGVRDTVLNNLILYDEEKYGVAARAAMKEKLVLSEAPDNTGTDYLHPWFVDYVLTEATNILKDLDYPPEYLFTGGLKVHTTMYPKVQVAMENAYEDDENFMESKTGDLVESGMVILNPATGEICGMVGGRRYGAKRGFNRATSAQRSPGSTIKPVVAYGPALDKGYGPGFVLDDVPLGGKFNPHNSDGAFKGRVTMRKALMESRNICAVKMLQEIGTEVGWSYGVSMGLPLDDSDAANSAMALGGIYRGVSPLEMAGAFATFANCGIYTKPYCVASIVDSRGNTIYEAKPAQEQIMSEQAAYLLTDMLIGAVTSGTGTNAKLKDWPTAGKTGTVELPSEDKDYAGKRGHKDIWFAGYTPELCGAVWMGYDNKFDDEENLQYLATVYGGGPTAKLWNVVMTACHEGMEVRQFIKPTGLVSVSIDTKSGKRPSSLTPAEFRSSDLYDSRYVPKEESKIWQVVDICADSNKKAGEFCPNKIAAVRMVVEGAISASAGDYALYAPKEPCDWHISAQGNLVSVYICTDKRHGVERVLANIPEGGLGGGCPAELVAQRNYGEAYLPTKYCTLADHGLNVNAGFDPNPPPATGGEGNNNPVTGVPGTNDPTMPPPGNNNPVVVDPGYPKDENGAPIMQTPHSLTIAPAGPGCVLGWAANNDPAATIYIVQKIVDSDQDTKANFQVPSAFTYYDEDVRAGHVYTYRVYAYNPEYNVISGWSQRVSFSI